MRLRKILVLVSVLLSCTIQAQDLKIHVDKKGKVGFADSNGNVVISVFMRVLILSLMVMPL